MPRREGQFLVEDFYMNAGGLNTADSPFVVENSQATDGYNWDYVKRGVLQKRAGHAKLNSVADAQLKSLGLGLWDKPGSTRLVTRASGRKLQDFDWSSFAFYNLYEDTAAGSSAAFTVTIASPGVLTATAHGLAITDPVILSTTGTLPTGLIAGTTYYVQSAPTADTFTLATAPNGSAINTSGSQSGTHSFTRFNTLFLSNGTTQPVVSSMFNTATTGVLWNSGGGLNPLYGRYSSTQVTKNGVAPPTASSFTATPTGAGSTITLAAGTYRYTLVYRKLSTQALSNADTALEASATVVGTNDYVALAWTLTNNDTTKYDKIYIYRSSVGGSAGFTAGALVTTVNSTATTYNDTGTSTSSSESVPRAGNTSLDNAILPSGTYNTITTFKRRLVTASGSTLYISDTNKSESWPSWNYITIPSGGDITSLAVISAASSVSSDIDEYLVIHKQREVWVVTGTGDLSGSIPDWKLKYLDSSGCIGQPLTVPAQGKLYWLSYRGVHSWTGSGKPNYISQSIENKFQRSGDIDKSKLNIGFGVFNQSRNEVSWVLSSGTLGEQKYSLKLDLRLSEDQTGVFTPDLMAFSAYSGLAFAPSATSTEDRHFLGDGSGFVYSGYSQVGDGASSVAFSYYTPYINCGSPAQAKRFNKLIVYVLDNGVYNLGVNYWGDFRFSTSDSSSLSLEVSPFLSSTSGVWDVTKWDQSTFDTSSLKIKALTYNFAPSKNNGEGDVFRLQFTETSSTNSPIIYGFSLYYSDLPNRK